MHKGLYEEEDIQLPQTAIYLLFQNANLLLEIVTILVCMYLLPEFIVAEI